MGLKGWTQSLPASWSVISNGKLGESNMEKQILSLFTFPSSEEEGGSRPATHRAGSDGVQPRTSHVHESIFGSEEAGLEESPHTDVSTQALPCCGLLVKLLRSIMEVEREVAGSTGSARHRRERPPFDATARTDGSRCDLAEALRNSSGVKVMERPNTLFQHMRWLLSLHLPSLFEVPFHHPCSASSSVRVCGARSCVRVHRTSTCCSWGCGRRFHLRWPVRVVTGVPLLVVASLAGLDDVDGTTDSFPNREIGRRRFSGSGPGTCTSSCRCRLARGGRGRRGGRGGRLAPPLFLAELVVNNDSGSLAVLVLLVNDVPRVMFPSGVVRPKVLRIMASLVQKERQLQRYGKSMLLLFWEMTSRMAFGRIFVFCLVRHWMHAVWYVAMCVMSFTVPWIGCTIVATANVVTSSSSADCPDCCRSVQVAMSCGGGFFSPGAVCASVWDSVKPMTGNFFNYSSMMSSLGVCMLNFWFSSIDEICPDNYNNSRFLLKDKCRNEKWELCLT